MVALHLPDGTLTQYGLSEVSRTTRARVAPGNAMRLKSVVGLREPVHKRLSEGDINHDPELSLFLRDETAGQYAYHYVKLGCSFYPAAGEVFDRAVLEVALRHADDGTENRPIVWSMSPLQASDDSEISVEAEMGSSFKLLSSKVKGGKKTRGRDVYIQGYGEGESSPFWEIRKTDTFTLDGSIPLHLIVRASADDGAEGQVTLSTFVRGRRFLIIPHETLHSEVPVIRFRL
jgi:hypothetical protein